MAGLDSRKMAAFVIFTIGTVTAHAAEQMKICHSGETIDVDANAWAAHQEHGDTAGACSDSPNGGAFQLVVCNGREGQPGRLVQLTEMGHVWVEQTPCP